MKRVLTLLLVLVLALAMLVACNDDNTGDNSGTTPPPAGDGTTDGGEGTPGDGGQTAPDEDLQAAYDYIKLTYKNLSVTTASFEVMKNAPIGEKIFAITWSTDNTAVTVTENEDGSFYVVNIPELGETAFTYTLKFSVENDKGEKKEGSFNLSVPKFTVNTFDEYAAAEDGEVLIVEGIVTGVMSKSNGTSTKENSIFLQDLSGKGGYYVYNLEEDPAGKIAVGMTVQVSGAKKTYNGIWEFTNATVTVKDETIKPVTPMDITALLAAADSLEAAELVKTNGALVTIKGVTLLEYSEGNGYHYFSLGNHKSYLRISSSSNCITEADGKALTEKFDVNFYNAVDITGIVSVYNGAIYLMPVSADPFTNITEQETPADVKVDIALKNTQVIGFVQATGDTKLPTGFSSFADLVITWELVSAEDNCATLTEGKLNVAAIPETAKTVTLKATFTLGDVSKTKEYTVTVKGVDTLSIKDIDNMVADFVKNQYTEEKFYVIGTIEQISSDIYGNMYIVATIDGAEYGVDIYGLYDANNKKYGDFEGYKPQVGDTIKVITVVGKYNNAQLKNAVLVEYNHNYDAGVVTPPTCQDDGFTTYTCKCGHFYTDNIVPKGDHYYGEGVTDTTDKVCTGCGVKNHTHTTVAGDVVPPSCTAEGYTVYACTDTECAFTEKKDEQPKLAHNDTDGDFLCDADGCDEIALPEAGSTLTIEQAIKLGKLFASNTYTNDKYYVTGTISEIYNAEYGNMYLTDGTNKFTIYGTYSFDGEISFKNLPVKPVAGDVVTIYGKIGTYGTTAQIKNGWIQHNNTVVVTAPTCTEGGFTTTTCKYCGLETVSDETAALEHNFVDGVCDREGCGALDHVHSYTEVVTAPTCTEDGYTTKTCACGDVQKVDVVPALNHIDENGDYKCDRTGCNGLVLPEEGTVLTVAEALKIGALFKNANGSSYAPNKYYIVGRITELTSTKYGTCQITDATGTIDVYGLKDSTGANRYENMDVKPVVGDTVKIYGELGAYYQSVQFNNSNVVEHTPHTTCEFSEATCKEKATCAICGKTEGDFAEHNFVDGTCSVCGIASDAPVKETVSVSKTHNDIASIAGVTAGQNTGVIANKNIALNEDITIVCAKGSATSDPCIYTESIRLYQNGATMTVKAKEGCEMTTIVIHLASKSDGQGPITVTGGTASALSNRTYTITVNAGVSEVVIKTAGTSKTTRLYVDNITVNYTK